MSHLWRFMASSGSRIWDRTHPAQDCREFTGAVLVGHITPHHSFGWYDVTLPKMGCNRHYMPWKGLLKGEQPQVLGDLRSPWSLTTYKSWDDPPSTVNLETSFLLTRPNFWGSVSFGDGLCLLRLKRRYYVNLSSCWIFQHASCIPSCINMFCRKWLWFTAFRHHVKLWQGKQTSNACHQRYQTLLLLMVFVIQLRINYTCQTGSSLRFWGWKIKRTTYSKHLKTTNYNQLFPWETLQLKQTNK